MIDTPTEGSELRLDWLRGRWVVLNPRRRARTEEFLRRVPVGPTDGACPLCPRADEEPALCEVNDERGRWLARVLANRYPVIAGDTSFLVTQHGPTFLEGRGPGIHDVIVLGPDHDAGWDVLPDDHLRAVMGLLQDRVRQHARTPGLRYSQALVNWGREAGASLEHPHGQLLGLPFVPQDVELEKRRFSLFKGNCLLCTLVAVEEAVGERIVGIDDEVAVISPYWAGSPYEMLVVPRRHEVGTHTAPKADLISVAIATKRTVAALRDTVGDVAYNIVFHSAPFEDAGTYHWHVHLFPRITTAGGFELGTGIPVNVVAPEEAASQLRQHRHLAA